MSEMVASAFSSKTTQVDWTYLKKDKVESDLDVDISETHLEVLQYFMNYVFTPNSCLLPHPTQEENELPEEKKKVKRFKDYLELIRVSETLQNFILQYLSKQDNVFFFDLLGVVIPYFEGFDLLAAIVKHWLETCFKVGGVQIAKLFHNHPYSFREIYIKNCSFFKK
jgi:hypothetical protein